MPERDTCGHSKFVVQTVCPDCGQELGHYEYTRRELSQAELQAQQPADLPDREAMSLVNANLAIPINIAAALNVLSDGSIAAAEAQQTTPIDQGNLTGNPLGS